MDITMIIVIVFGVVFIGGGLFAAHYGTKVSQREAEENRNKK